jgi:imidazoleglycerol-phosphate dehydratase
MTAEPRTARVDRVTRETEIHLTLSVDGRGQTDIATPIPFFSHMLDALCRHANFDVTLDVRGDIDIDQHHTVEDTGLVLGQALREALGDRAGIRRMGSAWVPMDEALAFCALDFSGRAFCAFDAAFGKDEQGGLELDLVPEFFRAAAAEARATLHLRLDRGDNEHHKVEALFKALGRALADAVTLDPARRGIIPSTKGTLG